MQPGPLVDALLEAGFRELAGVPCSILDPIVTAAEGDAGVSYVPASVEGEAVAIAAGAWLAGGLGAVLLQNSGLGNAVNPLASLALPYRIPLLLIVSWRGEPGRPDAAHHLPMGAATRGILELLEIPVEVLSEASDLGAVVARARDTVRERRPAAILVPRGLFEKHPRPAGQGGRAPLLEPRPAIVFGGRELPSRAEVIAPLLAIAAGAAIVSTTGYASRELAAFDGALHFPMQGSMGFALAIGLGIARVRREQPVFVLDGDGAAIMRLGSLATAGALRPARLVHLVLDNGSYASTGGQATVAPNLDFAGVALACGYPHAATCRGRESLGEALAWARSRLGEGPVLLRVLISAAEQAPKDRPKLAPPEIAARFRRHFAPASPPPTPRPGSR